jgi:hypothetical protein
MAKKEAKPKEPQPWERRSWPKQGDKILSKTYAAAGRALSQWERYEGVLSLVFSTFVAGTETQAAKRAYVAVRTFEARADMLRAASLAYFAEKPSDQHLQEPFKTILRDATCFGPRRNEIAHGVVDFYFRENVKCPVPLPEKLPEEAEYALYPSFASFKERSLTNAPTYCYTSLELNYFSGQFIRLANEAFIFALQLSKARGTPLLRKPYEPDLP